MMTNRISAIRTIFRRDRALQSLQLPTKRIPLSMRILLPARNESIRSIRSIRISVVNGLHHRALNLPATAARAGSNKLELQNKRMERIERNRQAIAGIDRRRDAESHPRTAVRFGFLGVDSFATQPAVAAQRCRSPP